MLIYDRRRCRPLEDSEKRRRLTLPQRAKLGHLEHMGWEFLFVRGEASTAFLRHAEHGTAALARDGRLIAVRSLPLRQQEPHDPVESAGPRPTSAPGSHAAA